MNTVIIGVQSSRKMKRKSAVARPASSKIKILFWTRRGKQFRRTKICNILTENLTLAYEKRKTVKDNQQKHVQLI